MDRATDSQIMSQVKAGDVERLATLFERYESRLLGFFVRLSGDREASEDMVQEVFYRVLRFRGTFKARGEFSPWIYTIARRIWIDRTRKGRPHTPLDDLESELRSSEPSPTQHVERQEEANLLHRALLGLADDKRDVLVLSRFENLRYEQIATILGCEVNTVKTRVHRALRQLREAYMNLAGVQSS